MSTRSPGSMRALIPETSTRPVGSAKSRLLQLQVVDGSVGHHRRPYAGAALFLVKNDRFVEAGETVHGGLPRGEVGVGADEPGKRPLHLAEGVGDLDQAAELNRAREIARRAHHKRKYDGDLAVADGEKSSGAFAAS